MSELFVAVALLAIMGLAVFLMEWHVRFIDRVEGEALREIDQDVRSTVMIEDWRSAREQEK